MVLDLTYEEVSRTVPLQDLVTIQRTGVNLQGLLALDRIVELAKAHGKNVVDLNPPFAVLGGLRYIAMVPTLVPLCNHALAVDETGVAYDPDPINERVRKSLSKYTVLALLEFRPLP
jgi:hypothetical protein